MSIRRKNVAPNVSAAPTAATAPAAAPVIVAAAVAVTKQADITINPSFPPICAKAVLLLEGRFCLLSKIPRQKSWHSFDFPVFASISEKKQLYFLAKRQSYGCGKKSAFFGKCRTFQESKKGEKTL